MKYEYYKDKYKTISIKLDHNKDADIIEYFNRASAAGTGPKVVITDLVRRDIFASEMIRRSGLFKIEEVK